MKNTPIPIPRFLSVPEVGKICGVSRNTVYNWVKKGVLEAYQTPGRTNLIRPGDLILFMNKSGMFIPEKLLELAENDAMEVGFAPKGSNSRRSKTKLLMAGLDDKSVNIFQRAVGEMAEFYPAQTGFEALHLLTVNPEISVFAVARVLTGLSSEDTVRQALAMKPDLKILTVSADPETAADLHLPLRVPPTRQAVQDALRNSAE